MDGTVPVSMKTRLADYFAHCLLMMTESYNTPRRLSIATPGAGELRRGTPARGKEPRIAGRNNSRSIRHFEIGRRFRGSWPPLPEPGSLARLQPLVRRTDLTLYCWNQLAILVSGLLQLLHTQRSTKMTSVTSYPFKHLTVESHENNIYVITLRQGDQNKLTVPFCQEIIRAFHSIQREIKPKEGGAVITRGSNEKFFCTGLELEDQDPWMSCDGFYPVSATGTSAKEKAHDS